MTRLRVLFALTAACLSVPAFAVDLSSDERAELRSRADGLIAERQRNPDWDGGTTRLSRTRGDVDLSQDRGEVKTPQRGEVKTKVKGGKKPRGEPLKKKMRRAVKEMPGALVRGR
jgi:hypothetical protein